jgi:hypothetical protein
MTEDLTGYRVSLIVDGSLESDEDFDSYSDANDRYNELRDEEKELRRNPEDAQYSTVIALFDVFECQNKLSQSYGAGELTEDDSDYEGPESYDYYR